MPDLAMMDMGKYIYSKILGFLDCRKTKMVKIASIIFGYLEAVPERIKRNIKEAGIECPLELLQKVCFRCGHYTLKDQDT